MNFTRMVNMEKGEFSMANIVLCGGSGIRLWPISRTLMAKQFVKLFDGQSLFQLTVERNHHICNRQYIVSNAEQFIGYEGELFFNADKPDGTMRKLTDTSKLHSLGWHHQVELEEGISKIYEWYTIGK